MRHIFPFFINHFLLASLISCLLVATGCMSSNRKNGPTEIIKLDEQRNTDAAQQLTFQALAHMKSNKQDDLIKAEKLLNEAIQADIMFGPAHNNLGKVYFKQAKYYSAAWSFQYAAKLMPGRSEPKNNLGLVFEATGQLKEAASQYEQAVTLSPDSPEYLGNLIRSRIRAGIKDQKTLEMLARLIKKEERLQWRRWAQKQHILINASLNSTHQSRHVFQSEAIDTNKEVSE